MPDIYLIYACLQTLRLWAAPATWGHVYLHNCRVNGFGDRNLSINYRGL